jgi:hypothetical protein
MDPKQLDTREAFLLELVLTLLPGKMRQPVG